MDGTSRRQYAEHVDYLVGAIIYLGTSTFWWGRTTRNMARELNLDEGRLKAAMDAFPGLFRRWEKRGKQYYCLQARYAQYRSEDGEEPDDNVAIDPIDTDTLKIIIDFVQKMGEQEGLDRRGRWTNGFALTSAILSALTTILVTAGLFGANPVQKASSETRQEPAMHRSFN
jgi:hypothetical protein